MARERRVRPLAVQLVGAQDERAVDGGALGAVGGDRVTVVQSAVLGVPARQLDAAAVIELDRQRVVADLRERAGLSVEDPDEIAERAFELARTERRKPRN